MKRAQKSNRYVVRVRETHGAPIANAKLTFGAAITQAVEMNGVEEIVQSAAPFSVSGKDLTFSLGRFQPRTFAVTLEGSPTPADSRRGPAAGAAGGSVVGVRVALPGWHGRLLFAVPTGETVQSIQALDVSGRVVRHLAGPGPSVCEAVWDEASGDGSPMSRGVYLVSLRTERTIITKRLVAAR